MSKNKKSIVATPHSVIDGLEAALKIIPRNVDYVNKILMLSPNFEKEFTQEEMDKIDAQHSYSKVFEKIKIKFYDKFSYINNDLKIIHDRTIFELESFYISNKTESKVYCDALFSDFLHSIFVLGFIWAKNKGNKEVEDDLFNYIFVVLYAMIIDKKKCEIYTFKRVVDEMHSGSFTINNAVGCQFFSMYFLIAHEVAHDFIQNSKSTSNIKEEELLADSLAYEIVLDLFLEEKQKVANEERELMDYCYLAPMMMLDVLDMYFKVYPKFSKNILNIDEEHYSIKYRIQNLFNILDKKYTFLTKSDEAFYANIIMVDFEEILNKFLKMVIEKEMDGSFEKLCEYISKFPIKKVKR